MKTYSPKPEHIDHRWYVMDASGQVLGRLATEVATLLRGKHKPIYAPHMDTGDHVIVINADKVELTGNKAEDKIAWRHSGYPGGIKGVPYGELLATRPIQAVEKAVRGMLPKNRLGRQMIKKLHIVPGPEHPHAAQQPVPLTVGERPAWSGLPATVTFVAPPTAVAQEAEPAAKAAAPATKPKAVAAKATKPAAKPKATAAKPRATAAKPKAAVATATKGKAVTTEPKAAAKPKPKPKPKPVKPADDEE